MTEKIDFRPYWLLYLDLAGFSKSIRQIQSRDRIAAAYSRIVAMIYEQLPTLCFGARWVDASDTHPFESVAASMRAATELVQRRVRIFSDSIFLFVEEEPLGTDPVLDPKVLPLFAAQSSLLLWEHGLPHRGAIAYGLCWLDANSSIFVGEPIVRAHEWEQQQEWLGISVEPSSRERFDSMASWGSIVNANVPTKAGRMPARCVDPVAQARGIVMRAMQDELKAEGGRHSPHELVWDEQERLAEFLEPALRSLEEGYREAVRSGSLPVVMKYINTATFLREECDCRHARLENILR
jgi:hypothetical protein